MEISVKTVKNVKVLAFKGSLDTQTSPGSEKHLNQLIEDGETKILANLAGVDYISSAGLRVLLATAKKLKAAGGGLRVCSLNELVAEVFDISGFDMILSVSPSESEALAGF